MSTVPNGWKLVPVEPTKAMREAYHAAREEAEYGHEDGSPDHQWKAMLASAPTPPTASAGEVTEALKAAVSLLSGIRSGCSDIGATQMAALLDRELPAIRAALSGTTRERGAWWW